ncbi:chemotaxis protein CheA [Carnobacteriaceae bacterium 52-44]
MDDNSSYQNLFYEETDKYLRELNDGVLHLEDHPDDIEILNSIFRSAHTLKGMAATMGLNTMTKLTHQMENVFELLKNQELEVTHELITLIFDCLDALANIVEDLQAGGGGGMDISRLEDQLIRLAEGETTVNAEEQEKDPKADSQNDKLVPFLETWDSSDLKVIEEGKNQGYQAYVIALRLDEETSMKSARAFLVMNKLETSGDLILSEPAIEELETGEFDGEINVLYLSKLNAQEVEELVLDVNEIDAVVVEEATEVLKEDEEKSEELEEVSEAKKDTKKEVIPKNRTKPKQTIRVDLNRLDQFMNLVSELVIHRSRLESISGKHQIFEVNEPLEQVERITSELQDVVLQLRMQPFSVAVQRFPRMIRDLADELGKDLKLVIQGEETELDRTVVTELGEPLVHLLRNAADHGVEEPDVREKAGKDAQGIITVGAFPEGNRVVVTVSDDGKGIDPEIIKESAESKGIDTTGLSEDEIIQLIFHPGFSTKKNVTGVSGRGVGMDVVKEKINSLNGTIEIVSELGKGSTFRITLPLTLSIIQSLLVKAGNETFALPQTVIEKVELYDENEITTVHHADVYPYDGDLIPVIYLSESLGFKTNTEIEPYVIIILNRDKYYAIVVDGLLEQKEIVIKDLGTELKDQKEYLGATILGDGEVVLIIDLSTICASERGKAYETI